MAGREAACDGRRTKPCGRGEQETTADGIGLAVSVLPPVRASGPTGTRQNLHPAEGRSARAGNDPDNRPPRSPGRMAEVPESECVAVRVNAENMPPMIAADGGHSDRVFCFPPPPLKRLSSGRKIRQGVHGGSRTSGPTLYVQYPGPWEIVASWNVDPNGGENVAAGAGRRCRPGWWTLLVQLKNFFQFQHSPVGEPARE